VSLVTPCDPQWAKVQFQSCLIFIFALSFALKKREKRIVSSFSCLKHFSIKRKKLFFLSLVKLLELVILLYRKNSSFLKFFTNFLELK
jgi:hypothetical protein